MMGVVTAGARDYRHTKKSSKGHPLLFGDREIRGSALSVRRWDSMLHMPVTSLRARRCVDICARAVSVGCP